MTAIFKSLAGLTFIGVILEMVLPEGNFSKYIRSLFGVIMLTVLLSGILHIKPKLEAFDMDFFITENDVYTEEFEKILSNEIVLSAEKTIRARIEAENIEITSLLIDFDSENKIKKLIINIKESSVFKEKVIEILTKEFEIDEKTVIIGE